ncbi:MAG: ATP-binding cassette domain-containing protein [Candidatus Handelsmanbacteria bacterium]|nr:ATP-binding cassette domain-containing protein [Candidatus Handelsmanbacteria bacterium]
MEERSSADAVVLEGVRKSFGEKVAIEELWLRIPAGCICGFLGPNGAGKTTTIRMIIGIFRPDAGQLRVLGQTDPSLVKHRLGYLPEEKGLYKKMRVRDLILYFAQLKGMAADRARQRANELLATLDLAEWADRKCEALSKGMGQKLQILVSLIHRPELVILDEPFSGLDPLSRDAMRDLILELRREGRTVIFSTHVMEQAEQLCDRVVLIDRGRKLVEGPVEEVRASAGRSVQVEAEGAVAWEQLPGVAGFSSHGRQADLTLAEGADPQRLLAALVGQARVRRFEVRATSLHEVFVRAVGGRRDADL